MGGSVGSAIKERGVDWPCYMVYGGRDGIRRSCSRLGGVVGRRGCEGTEWVWAGCGCSGVRWSGGSRVGEELNVLIWDPTELPEGWLEDGL